VGSSPPKHAEESDASGAGVAGRAAIGVGLLGLRYLAVGLLNLGGSVFLIRRVGPEGWASYSTALFIVTFIDQQLGARLLGALHTRPALDTALLNAAAAVTQGTAVICLLLLIAGAWIAGEFTALPNISHMILAAGACACIYSWRALPVALLERRLAFRWIAGGEALDQVTFLAIAAPAVALGAGLEAVAIALAVRGVPALFLFRFKVRTPWLGRAGPEIRRVLSFALPGSVTAVCFLLEGLLPLVLLGEDHPTLLGFVMTAATLMSYPALLAIVLPRIALPALSQVKQRQVGVSQAVADVGLAAGACLMACVGTLAVTSPWWLSILFGTEWKAAWPQVVAIAGSYLFIGQVNVAVSGLLAQHKTRETAMLAVAMLSVWTVAAVAILSAVGARWILVGLVASKAVGFVLAWRLVSSDNDYGRAAWTLVASLGAIGSMYTGAAAISAGSAAAAIVATASLLLITAAVLFASRGVLKLTWSSAQQQVPLLRRLAHDDANATVEDAS
jgi:O-antigen/teichoic acid export membrane protein